MTLYIELPFAPVPNWGHKFRRGRISHNLPAFHFRRCIFGQGIAAARRQGAGIPVPVGFLLISESDVPPCLWDGSVGSLNKGVFLLKSNGESVDPQMPFLFCYCLLSGMAMMVD